MGFEHVWLLNFVQDAERSTAWSSSPLAQPLQWPKCSRTHRRGSAQATLAVLHRAISNPHHAIWNRCDLKSLRFGRLRCEFFSKTIEFHCFLYAYGFKRYFPALIRSAKAYTVHRVVDFLQYIAYISMISGPQRQLRERNPRELWQRESCENVQNHSNQGFNFLDVWKIDRFPPEANTALSPSKF